VDIEKINKVKNEILDKFTCPISSESFSDNAVAMWIPCGHNTTEKVAKNWYDKQHKTSCPCCTNAVTGYNPNPMMQELAQLASSKEGKIIFKKQSKSSSNSSSSSASNSNSTQHKEDKMAPAFPGERAVFKRITKAFFNKYTTSFRTTTPSLVTEMHIAKLSFTTSISLFCEEKDSKKILSFLEKNGITEIMQDSIINLNLCSLHCSTERGGDVKKLFNLIKASSTISEEDVTFINKLLE
jgi:hypothetical protein